MSHTATFFKKVSGVFIIYKIQMLVLHQYCDQINATDQNNFQNYIFFRFTCYTLCKALVSLLQLCRDTNKCVCMCPLRPLICLVSFILNIDKYSLKGDFLHFRFHPNPFSVYVFCRSLDLTGPLLLGGVPNLPEDFPVRNREFVGCMRNLTIDSKPIDMASYIANNGTAAGMICCVVNLSHAQHCLLLGQLLLLIIYLLFTNS